MLQFLFWIFFMCWLMASAVLILVVLVQSGKGGGLSGLVGAGSALGDHLGATGAEKTLNRWTTYCAVAFVTLTIILVFFGPIAFRRSSPFYRVRAVQTESAAPPAEAQATAPASPETVAPVDLSAGIPPVPEAEASDLGVTIERDEPPAAEAVSPAAPSPVSPAPPADTTPDATAPVPEAPPVTATPEADSADP